MFSPADEKKLGLLFDKLVLLYRKGASEPDYDIADEWFELHQQILKFREAHKPSNEEEEKRVENAIDRFLGRTNRLRHL